jgi:pimeloyl-ACP methyl ester carboxylesterase
VALLIVEIPGTGDNPGAPSDPESPDRVWSSLFDWVDAQEGIDNKNVANIGFSTGGYYSIRVAHTHADRLKGVVALGGGCHHMFDPEWLDAANDMEYPFEYVPHPSPPPPLYFIAYVHTFSCTTNVVTRLQE